MRPKDGVDEILYQDMTTREVLHANLDVLLDKISQGAPGADVVLNTLDGKLEPMRVTVCFWKEENRCPKCQGTGSYEPTDDPKEPIALEVLESGPVN